MRYLFILAYTFTFSFNLVAQSNLFDPTFGQAGQSLVDFGHVNDVIYDFVVMPDKTIIALGQAYNGSNMDMTLAKFSANGQLDPTFGNHGKLVTNELTFPGKLLVQPDGKILVGGSIIVGSSTDFAVFRFLPNGAPDSSFVITGVSSHNFFGGYDYLLDMILLPDGKILCAGSANQSGEEKMALMLLNSNGFLDFGFGNFGTQVIDLASGSEQIQAITPYDNDHFIAVGRSKNNGSNYDFAVCKFTFGGSLDSTFGVNGSRILPIGTGDDQASQVLVFPDHRIIAAGKTGVSINFNDIAMVGLDSTGQLLPDFGTNGKVISTLSAGNDVPNSLIYLDDQHFLVAAIVNMLPTISSNTDFALLQYRTDGQLDSTFGANGMILTEFWGLKDEAYAVFLTSDNLIYLGGSATNPTENKNFALARYDLDGQLDISFGQNGKVDTDIGQSSDNAYAMALLPDESILLSGRDSWETGNSTRFALTKLHTDGKIDSIFGQYGMATIGEPSKNCFSFGLAVEPVSGKIVQAGSAGVGLTRDFMIARFLGNGTVDSTFNGTGKLVAPLSPGDDQAQTVHLTADGKIIAVGFAVINNNYQLAVIRVQSDGTLDPAFGIGGKVFFAPGNLWTVGNTSVLLPNGNILVGGETSFPNGSNTSVLLAMFKPNGELDTGFGQGGFIRHTLGIYRNEARKLLRVIGDNSIVVVGRTSLSSDSDVFVMRLLADGQIDSTFGLNGSNILSKPGTIEQVNDAVFQNGRILVAGFSSTADIYSNRRFLLARFTSDGQIDSTFSINGLFMPYTNATPDSIQYLTSEAWGVAVQTDDKIVAGGSYRAATNSDMLAIRLYPALTSGLTHVSEHLSLRIYPNPASDWFHLEVKLKKKGDIRVSLFNSAGQMAQSWPILRDQKPGQLRESLLLNPQLPAGHYFLSVESEQVRGVAGLFKK